MKYELMVFNSCGHVTIEEVSQKMFVRYTQELGWSALAPSPPCRFRVGRTRSRAYVYPGRYMLCKDCVASFEELEASCFVTPKKEN